jgi:hypothetical protein
LRRRDPVLCAGVILFFAPLIVFFAPLVVFYVLEYYKKGTIYIHTS